MPSTVTSPNMGIVVPVVLTDTGPDWATRIYNALYSTIDAHNHASGNGMQVPTAGININADLSFNSYNETTLRSSRYVQQSSALAQGSDVACLYSVSGDAYWNDASGTAIQLTKNHALNATFQNWNTKLTVSGNYTILSTDTYELYFVNTSGGAATINIPASSALTPGRIYILEDWKANSETNSISVVPNGTDKINGANSTYVFQQNGGELTLMTDGAGNWVAEPSGTPWLRAGGINYTGSFSVTASTGLTETATSGNITFNAGGAGVINWQQAGSTIAQVLAAGLGIGGTALLAFSGTNVNLLQTILNWTGGSGRLQSNGTDIASIVAGGLAIGGTAAPTITSGSGAPATSPPNGSIYLRTDGGNATLAIYARQSAAWSNIASGLTAIVSETQRTVTSSYTVDNSGSDYEILCNGAGAITITLPTPTAGRVIKVTDISGNCQTNNITLAQHASEKISGVAASRVLQTNWGSWTVTSNGTDWFLD